MPLQPIPGINWFDIADPDSKDLDELAKRYGLHELEVEDCRHSPQRAKVNEHDEYQFCILKRLEPDASFGFREFCIFHSKEFLITVHRNCSPVTDHVRDRANQENCRRLDRLFYMAVDQVVDEYLPVLDQVAEETSDIEDMVLERPDPTMLRRIFELKRKLIRFRANASAMREVVNALMRREGGLLGDDLDAYFRDVYDHIIRVTDLVESYRDLLSGSLDIYLSAVANRTNEVMKVLTVWGTIALPLVIITGFFGMNFEYMPWLRSPHGLRDSILVMALSTLAVVAYFRRKGWF